MLPGVWSEAKGVGKAGRRHLRMEASAPPLSSLATPCALAESRSAMNSQFSKHLHSLPSPLSGSSSAKAGLALFLHWALEKEPPFCECPGPPLDFECKVSSQEPPTAAAWQSSRDPPPRIPLSFPFAEDLSHRPPLCSQMPCPFLICCQGSSVTCIPHTLPLPGPLCLQGVSLPLEGTASSYVPQTPGF